MVRFGVEPGRGVMLFGLITVGCGLVGTLLGSVILDYVLKKYNPDHPNIEEIRTLEGTKMLFFAVLFSTLCGILAALSADLTLFLVLLAGAEFLIFL